MKNNKNYIVYKMFLAFLLSFFTFSVFASALKGVKETTIVIERLDEDHVKCGITENMIDAAVRIPISNSRLKITNRQTSGFIYVNVGALSFENFCVVSIQLTYAKFIISENESGRFWFKSHLMSWNRNDIGLRVTDRLEALTKELIAAWLKANQN